MDEVARIRDQLRRSVEGDAWHGPALRELLADVTPEEAAARPVDGAHGIGELVLHVAAWQDAARRRLEGVPLAEPEQGDWPEVPGPGAAGWEETLRALDRSYRALLEALERVDAARLDEPVLPGFSSVYVLLHGVVQHNLYHAGQIALLKRALRG